MTTRAESSPLAAPGAYPAPVPPPELPGPAPVVRTAAAGRRTNRKMLVLSVLVVLLGGVLALSAGQLLTRHTTVLAVARPVQAGAPITAADLAVASVTTDPHLAPIPAGQQSQVVGMLAQVALSPGELLTRAEIGTGSGFTPGQVLVAVPVKPGQVPVRGLTAGQRVLVVPTRGSSGAPSSGSAPPVGGTSAGAPGSAGISATVVEVGSADAGSALMVVDVRVSAADGIAMADLASTGNLAVVLLPAGG